MEHVTRLRKLCLSKDTSEWRHAFPAFSFPIGTRLTDLWVVE